LIPQAITPAALVLKDGAAFSEQFGDTYWSLAGGLEETRHVFLSGNDLPARWAGRERFTLLETGFGTGLNFLCTWQRWRDTAPAGARLHYVAVDKHPFRRDDLAQLYRHWPELAPLGAQLLQRYPPLVPGFQRIHLDGGRVNLTLLWGEAAQMLAQLDAQVDTFFLDGFAPARNPGMWSEALFSQLARLAAPGATCATYTVAGEVRRGLAEAGFAVEKRPGFGRKREMLSGRYSGNAATLCAPPDRAVIIGAGIAGTLCAERLAAQGWQVDMVERRDAPARETSGNPAGVLQPVPSADWNRLSRATLAGFHYALRRLQEFAERGPGLVWQQSGVLRLARDARAAGRQKRIADAGVLPPEVLRWVEIAEASALAGWPAPAPGWWFPEGCWVHPPSLCAAALRAAGDAVRLHVMSDAIDLVRSTDGWHVTGAGGKTIAEAPVVILANGHLARRFAPAAWLPLRPVRGQITCIPAEPGRVLRTVVAREGYVTPATSFGVHVVGATYEEGSTDEATRDADHRANIERLKFLLPDFAATVDASRVAGRAGIRTVGPDRLPLVGAIPQGPDNDSAVPGLYGLLGLGSRGLVYAPLLAELLACRLGGEPLPLEADLAHTLSFARLFGRRPARKQRDDSDVA
jgi:tRNA 5-methylaminomethyl-2-thiouridine biosynthesis bifunctional protein